MILRNNRYLYTLIFYKQLRSGHTPQSSLFFQDFWGTKFLCEEYSNFRYLWSVILKFSECFWDSWISVNCRFNKNSLLSYFTFITKVKLYLSYFTFITKVKLCLSYFMFITKAKLYLSFICSFYCCLLKEDWALKYA